MLGVAPGSFGLVGGGLKTLADGVGLIIDWLLVDERAPGGTLFSEFSGDRLVG